MEIRKISGAEAPARPTISPVVKKRLKAGATCATPGMITPNRPSWPCCSDGADLAAFLGAGLRSPFRARDALVDPPGQRDRDEDVLLPGQHEGRRGDLAQAADGVVPLDHRE